MKTDLEKIISGLIYKKYHQTFEVEIFRPNIKFGDFSTNIAIKLAKITNEVPITLANEIADELRIKYTDIFKTINVAGPGFLNFIMLDNFLLSANSFEFNIPELFNKNIVIETNNPNPFKLMHIGHALNAIVGDSLANLLEIGGAKVHRVSYHGDIGSHVGKIMWAILDEIDNDPNNLNKIDFNKRGNFLSDMYVKGVKAYENNQDTKQAIDILTDQSYKLDDPIYKEVYLTCRNWSFDQIDKILQSLGSKVVERRYLESEVEKTGVKIVKNYINKYFFLSNGAIIFRGEDYGLFTTVFVSSSGRGLYAARDLGLIDLKQKDFHPDQSFIITASEQKDYFKVVTKVSELCQIENKNETKNITTGIVKLTTGKMSSRHGDVIDINWLIDEVILELKKYNNLVSSDLVIGTIRYQFLKVKLGSDIVFDIKQAISLQGNSGPYLMYAYVRANSIINKLDKTDNIKINDYSFEDNERNLLIKLSDFKDVMNRSISQLKPHYLCNYLYELSQEFNRFYENNKVIGTNREVVRLYLVKLYAQVLKTGLSSLGINTPDKM